MGPAPVTETSGLDIGPHPHTGLQTVTWLLTGEVHGVQLWVAQPERTRHGAAAFEHHPELPRAEVGGAVGTVLAGSFAGATSPTRRDSDLVGVDGALRPGTSAWPLEPAFEYALVVLVGQVRVQGQPVRPGRLAYLGLGRDQVELSADDPARLLLLGGVPFPEPILMWWNFVARTREEIATAARRWRAQEPRFGRVDSPLARLRVPPLPHGWSSGSSGSR